MSAEASHSVYAGIEQFGLLSSIPGLDYCISESRPYSLEVINQSDVICLLLGNIESQTQYDDGPTMPLTFSAETAAFHPRGSRMRIDAQDVRQRFMAFRYSDAFQRTISDQSVDRLRRAGSADNIRAAAIRHLARYARQKVSHAANLDPWEIQCLATLAYIETTRQLAQTPEGRKIGMSDAEFTRLENYVAENIECNLICADMVAQVNLPARIVFDGVKARTGYSLYRFVLEKRLGTATRMLRETDSPLSDVAAACGFSSQQHMTALFSDRLGVTPLRFRKNGV
jgi:AraC family transcriptional regulator